MKWLIELYKAKQHIKTQRELAELLGWNTVNLNNKIKNPRTLKLYELESLDSVLHFDDADIIKLVRGKV